VLGREHRRQLGYEDALNRGDEANEMGNYLLTIDLGTEKTLKQFKSGLAQACTILSDDTIKCWGMELMELQGLGD